MTPEELRADDRWARRKQIQKQLGYEALRKLSALDQELGLYDGPMIKEDYDNHL